MSGHFRIRPVSGSVPAVIGWSGDPAGPEGDSLAVRAPAALMPVLAGLTGLAVLSLVTPVQGTLFDTVARGWLTVACEAAAAVSCLWRAWAARADRTAWLLFGAGITAYAAGDAVYLLRLRPDGLLASPSVADPLWLAFYPCAYAATFLLLLRTVRRYHWSVWLDGALVGLAAAAIVRAFAFPPVLELVRPAPAVPVGLLGNLPPRELVVAVGLAYPIADLVLVGVTVWAVSLRRSRRGGPGPLLGAAFACLVVADVVFAVRNASGGWSLDVVSRVGYPLAMALIGTAAWRHARPAAGVSPGDPRILALPCGAGVAAAAVVASDRFDRLPAGAYWLAVLALGLVVVRVVLFQRGVRPLRARLRDEADFAAASVGMAIATADGHWVRVNPALGRLLGRDPAQLAGQRLAVTLRAADVPAVTERLAVVAAGAPPEPFEATFVRPDGRPVDVLVALAAHPERATYLTLHAHDVSAERRAARSQGALAALGRRALECADVPALFEAAAVLCRDALAVDECRVVGPLGPGGGVRPVAGPDPGGAGAGEWGPQAAYTLLEAGPVISDDLGLEERFPPGGTTLPWRSSASAPVPQRDGSRYVLVASHRCRGRFGTDDTDFLEAAAGVLASAVERLESEEVTRLRGLHDPLTGLANRALCTSHLELAVAHARRTGGLAAALLLDLDRFKVVNDTHGHGVGDKLLRAIAPRLRKAVREDDIVSRFGGDEFVVVCPEVGGEAEVLTLAERIRAAFRHPLVVAGHELTVRPSIGIATSRGGDTGPEALIRNADLAMYRAKERGGDSCELFDEELRRQLLDRVDTERALRTGVEEGHLTLLYQPVVDLASGQLDRFEALLRWNRPGHGVLEPTAFLDAAQETGLIRPIGDWVLRTVCAQLADWNAAGHPDVTVAVNLSARQLGPGVVGEITGHLAAAGVRPDQLDVELTETLLMDTAGAASVVRDLRAAGVRVTLDDFGTGYSSLGYLRTFALDALKLDRTFIQTLDLASGPAASILRAVTEMARALGLRVTAEGVEEPHQLALVCGAGCHAAQGHLFARALDVTAATAMLAGDPPWAYRPGRRHEVVGAEG